MKRILAAVVLLALILCAPIHGLSEDQYTVQLARVIYAVARDDSYEAKQALASVVMNRVDNPWYPDTLAEVLDEKHQFPAGKSYDDESLKAAHAAVSGTRTVDSDMVEWSSEPISGRKCVKVGDLYIATRN